MSHTEDLEKKIVETAKQVFMEKGFQNTSMSDIAAAVGISRTALHYYFRTKDKIFQAVFGTLVLSFTPKIQDILSKDAPFFEKVDRIIDEYFRIFSENPYLPRFIMGEVNRDAGHLLSVAEKMGFEQYIHAVIEAIEVEIAAGHIRRVPVHVILLSFVSQVTFPFMARKLIYQILCGENKEEDFKAVVEECKRSVSLQMRLLLDPANKVPIPQTMC